MKQNKVTSKVLFGLIIGVTFAITLVTAVAASAGETGPISTQLESIATRVKQCALLPYSLKESHKTNHAIMSRCSQIKLGAPGTARITLGDQVFLAKITASANSDGDFYDLTIQSMNTRESAIFQNILAYGDVLLAVVSGDTSKLQTVEVTSAEGHEQDESLLRFEY